MCFNAETSLAAFIFGMTCATVMLVKYKHTRQRRHILLYAVLLMFVCSMQLIEYVLWRFPTCGEINRAASLAIIVLLALQPLSKIAVSLWLYDDVVSPMRRRLAQSVMVVLLVTAAAWFHHASQLPRLCSIKDDSSCRLQWAPIAVLFERVHPAIVVIFLLAYGAGLGVSWQSVGKSSWWAPIYSYGVGTLLFALIYAYTHKRAAFYTIFGSMWCFLAVGAGAIGVWKAYEDD